MKRLLVGLAFLALLAALCAAVFSFWVKPRALLEQRRWRKETRHAIASQPFVRARTDSGYALVTGRRCAPFAPDTSGVVEFCLEKKTSSGEVLQYTFERYGYATRASSGGACRVMPKTGNGWECPR